MLWQRPLNLDIGFDNAPSYVRRSRYATTQIARILKGRSIIGHEYTLTFHLKRIRNESKCTQGKAVELYQPEGHHHHPRAVVSGIVNAQVFFVFHRILYSDLKESGFSFLIMQALALELSNSGNK